MTGFRSILIAGCGNMGGAMLSGWLAAGLEPGRFTVADPLLGKAPAGVALLRAVPGAGDYDYDAIVLGVKPQVLGEIAALVEPLAGPGTVVLSVLAGIELATLAAHFPRAAGHVRVMPNLAAALGKSPVVLVAQGLDSARRKAVTALMAPLGQAEWLEDESLMDLVTALAGSGPAFVYRFIDALAAGAAQLGLPRSQAERLALATVEGAAVLAGASGLAPGELARRVASPGGTTERGLAVLDEDDALARLIARCLRAARDRSAELAAMARSGK